MGHKWRTVLSIICTSFFLITLVISGLVVFGINVPLIVVPQITELRDKVTVALSFTTAFFAMMSFSINASNNFKKNELDKNLIRSKQFDSKFSKFQNTEKFDKNHNYIINVVNELASLYSTVKKIDPPIIMMSKFSGDQGRAYNAFKDEFISFAAVESSWEKTRGTKPKIKKNLVKIFSEIQMDTSYFMLLIDIYGLSMDAYTKSQIDVMRKNSLVFAEFYSRRDRYQSIKYQIILEMFETMLIHQRIGELAYNVVQSANLLMPLQKKIILLKIEEDDYNYLSSKFKKNAEIMRYLNLNTNNLF